MADLDWPGAIADALGDDPDGSVGGADTGEEQGAGEAEAQVSAPQEVATDTFFDPQTLAPELQEQWKRMQGAYTRRSQALAEDRKASNATKERLATMDKFYNDADYARAVIERIAPELGYELRPRGTGTPAPQGTPTTMGLDSLMASLTDNLGPELAFLAPKLAPALLATVQQAVAPVQQAFSGQSAQARRSEEERLMADLDTRAPGWEETHGLQMRALDAFLNSDELTHPTFGNKYELYLRMLNPGLSRQGVLDASKRAAGNRIASGRPGPRVGNSLVDRIRETQKKTGWNDAWAFAKANVDGLSQELGG